jgi:hypothetical protein
VQSSDDKVLEQIVETTVFEHTDDKRIKKPNKPPKNLLGMKKGK